MVLEVILSNLGPATSLLIHSNAACTVFKWVAKRPQEEQVSSCASVCPRFLHYSYAKPQNMQNLSLGLAQAFVATRAYWTMSLPKLSFYVHLTLGLDVVLCGCSQKALAFQSPATKCIVFARFTSFSTQLRHCKLGSIVLRGSCGTNWSKSAKRKNLIYCHCHKLQSSFG